jgi:predicted phage terminase large subunit-like protein
LARAQPWIAKAEQGKVALVRGAWTGDFLAEVEAFPQGAHDDQVDALSGACQLLGMRTKQWRVLA